jgi:hypothetical protein
MKAKYRLFRRGKIFYAENATTGKQQSLHTSDTQEAKRLIAAKNEAVNNAQLTLAVGKAYLAVTDPEMLTRTWFEVIGFVERRGGESTQGRAECAESVRRVRPADGHYGRENSTLTVKISGNNHKE